MTEPEISLDGDRATGTVTWTWVGRGDADTPVMRLLGHYDDSLRARARPVAVPAGGSPTPTFRTARSTCPPAWAGLARSPPWRGGAACRGAGQRADRLRRLEDLEQIRQLFVEY